LNHPYFDDLDKTQFGSFWRMIFCYLFIFYIIFSSRRN
jgi:hypothetical protein